MAYKNHGETDWDEQSTRKSDFIKLKIHEENQIRVITKPHKYNTHQVKFIDDTNKKNGGGWRVRCAGEGCILCKIAKAQEKDSKISVPEWAEGLLVSKIKPRWYIGVLVRDVNPVKAGILEIGSLIRNRLKELFNNKKWGDPRNYDITIKINPNSSSAMEFYSVDGDPVERGPLDADLQKTVDEFDLSELGKRCEPASNEDIEKMVEIYRGFIDKAKQAQEEKQQPKQNQNQNKRQGQSSKQQTPPKQDDFDDDDADFDFKDEVS